MPKYDQVIQHNFRKNFNELLKEATKEFKSGMEYELWCDKLKTRIVGLFWRAYLDDSQVPTICISDVSINSKRKSGNRLTSDDISIRIEDPTGEIDRYMHY